MIKKGTSAVFLFLFSFACLPAGVQAASCVTGNPDSAASKKMALPSVRIGAGMLSYFGNVGTPTALIPNSYSDTRSGFSFGVEERISNFFALSLDGLYGHLSGNDHGPADYLNFETKVMNGSLSLIMPFDNGKIMSKGNNFVPFISMGLGYMTFQPFGDLTDKYGHAYNYWDDGSIRSVPESSPLAAKAVLLRRSYNYNTPLAGAQGTLTLPVGLGFNIHFTDQFSAKVGLAYHYTFTNHIDNANSGPTDKFVYSNVSIQYQFGKMSDKDDGFPVEADNTDSDADGIPDLTDLCPGTPSGVPVDSKGCPLDTDEDGIPDYLDKEPNSKKGALVDEHGMTIDYKKVAAKHKEDLKMSAKMDSVADAMSKYFNNKPRKQVLDSLEKNRVSLHRVNNKQIPSEFTSVDKNKDGMISVAELNMAIDEFFSGTTELTVDKINRLIDYFFEQL